MPPDVRAMTRADLAVVAALSAQLGYPVSEEELARRFERLSGARAHALFVAGAPAGGWLHVEQRDSLESGESGEIVGLVVDAGRRREGLGRALVARAVEWAQARGLKRLRVRSNVVREESHRFYPALGFRLDKTQHVYALPLSPPEGGGVTSG